MKLAIVFDDLIQFGGAERLLLSVCEIWPKAPLYTAVASKKWQQICKAKGITLKTSFLQKFPFAEKLNKFYALLGLHILAYENFDFSDFDVVLSVSARFAHGVITKPGTSHICYMNSPARMFWEPQDYFMPRGLRKLAEPFLSHFRVWDYVASQRVDHFIANSKTPQARIKKYYKRDSVIIYPFVDTPQEKKWDNSKDFYLLMSRLVPWKRVDVAIEACGKLGLPLKIAGSGTDEARLKRLASKCENINFEGYVGDDKKWELLHACKALIQTQCEDFGLVPLEAMACGKPVVAYGSGGALETVLPGETGAFFADQNAQSLEEVLRKTDFQSYSSESCFKQAKAFDKKSFQGQLKKFVDIVYLKNL